MTALRVLDTFAGAGGFSLGFQMAGCKIAGAVESDAWAAETFQFNHPDATVLVDRIESLSDQTLRQTFQSHRKPDIVLGGPPCQGFSRCRREAGDPKDPRNSLFREFLRIGDLFNPKLMIMENVPNLLKAKTGNRKPVIDVIYSELAERGFHVYWEVLDATRFGVPQIRRRLFVVACKEPLDWPFPESTHMLSSETQSMFDSDLPVCPSLWEAISDLPKIAAREGAEVMAYDKLAVNEFQESMRKGASMIHNHKAMNHSKRIIQRFAAMSWGQSVSDVPEHLKPHRRNSNGTKTGKGYDQNNRRMHPDRPCHTIPASFYANFVHPYQNRNFTAREGARIQTFPDWYVFKGKPTVVSHKLLAREQRNDERFLCQYSQIGNAVPPLLAQRLAENILAQIRTQEHCNGARGIFPRAPRETSAQFRSQL